MKTDHTNLIKLVNDKHNIGTCIKKKATRLEKKGRCVVGPILFLCYKIKVLQPIIFRLLDYLENGIMFSQTQRKILRTIYGVNIGKYSYLTSLKVGMLPGGTKIGNYCSIADGFTVLRRRNHPIERVSQHPLFFNHQLGLVSTDTIQSLSENPLTVGHDVWIGANVLITAGCKSIGNGAIVVAGTVVTKDVPAFAIIGGVPGKLIRWRFTKDAIALIEESSWWLHPLSDLIDLIDLFEQPLNIDIAQKIKHALAPEVH